MTSAVLAGRNEVHHAHPDHRPWGGVRGAALMPRPPKPNPRRHRPSPNPNNAPPPPPAPWQQQVAPPPPPYAAPPDFHATSRYVTIRLSEMTRLEARQAQARLAGELGRVRGLLARIDTWQDVGRRRGAPDEPDGGPGPRPRHASSPTPPPPLRAAMLKRCGQILTRLRKHKVCHLWFNYPVDVEGLKLYDYRAIIRTPMDLGTVKQNLAGGRYPSHEEFAADVRLTFNNALRYNPPGHDVHTVAGNLLAFFDGLYKEAVSWFEQELQRLDPLMPAPLAPPLPLPPQPPVAVPVQVVQPPRIAAGGRRPKPKAMDPNKREMDVEEKAKLREEIENLPENMMGGVLQIVQKRNGDPVLMDEEVVELDFDELDVETLWELDRFVLNWRKACSNNMRVNGDGAALVHGDTVDVTVVPDGDDTVQVDVNSPNPPAVVEIGDSEADMPPEQATEADMADEYVDIGDEMPTVNYQSVEIEKEDTLTQAASSSSESGTASSSNGSDSRSSGDTDSDGDDASSAD